MNARDHIISKQIQWARNQGIELTGSKGKGGRKAYKKTLNDNLFETLSLKKKEGLLAGDGNELAYGSEFPSIAKLDGIKFHDLSYQEIIIYIVKNFRVPHQEYVEYINDRYV